MIDDALAALEARAVSGQPTSPGDALMLINRIRLAERHAREASEALHVASGLVAELKAFRLWRNTEAREMQAVAELLRILGVE